MLRFIKNLKLLEISLIKVIFYGLIWLSSEYMATLLTSIIVPIISTLLIISLIAEFIEKSKVPKSYFKILALSIIIPIIVALFFYQTYDGVYDWIG